MKLSALTQLWDRFWFAPVSPYPVAAFRILFGLIVLQGFLFFSQDLFVWYGANGIVSLKTVLNNEPFVRLNVLNIFPNNDNWMLAMYCLYAVAAFCLTIGFKTRMASILVYVLMVSFFHRNQYHLNSGDTLMRAMSFWMMFAPTGRVWSVDALLDKNRAKDSCELISAWSFRALQLEVTLVYLHTWFAKSGGFEWGFGTAVYYASRLEPLYRLPLPVSFDWHAVSWIFTWMTLLVEFLMFTAIWVKELRYYVLTLALAMHLTIDWNMAIPQFEWLMIFSYVLFIFPEDLNAAIERLKSLVSKPRARSSA